MHTHFLGKEEVDAYLREFAGRLRDLGDGMPTVWCPIGASGQALAERLAMLAGPAGEKVQLLKVSFERDKNEVTFQEGDPDIDLKDRLVLIIDSAIHGGQTMHRVVKKVGAHNAKSICTYGLVVKKGTRFVPSYWALMIDDYDRAYFLLDEIPTQRLSKDNPFFHLRKLQEEDLRLPPVKSKLESLNRITWNDRFYDMASSGGAKNSYVLEVGSTVVGYLTVEMKEKEKLTIHEVAVDSAHAGKKFGAALMRWAETIARNAARAEIDLWAIDNQVGFYERLGYKQLPERKITLADGEAYLLMRKPILHHV